MSGFQKGELIHCRMYQKSGMSMPPRLGRGSAQILVSGVISNRKLKDITHVFIKPFQHFPFTLSGRTVECFSFTHTHMHTYIHTMKSRDLGRGAKHKLLLSISIVFNVCRAVLPSLHLELLEIIKEFENAAKNPQSLADIRTYHPASSKAGTT